MGDSSISLDEGVGTDDAAGDKQAGAAGLVKSPVTVDDLVREDLLPS